MIETMEELQEFFRQWELAGGDPHVDDIADNHVRVISDLFSEWSDNELGFLLTDIVQILRLKRDRADIISRIIAMVKAHTSSNLIEQTILSQLRSQN